MLYGSVPYCRIPILRHCYVPTEFREVARIFFFSKVNACDFVRAFPALLVTWSTNHLCNHLEHLFLFASALLMLAFCFVLTREVKLLTVSGSSKMFTEQKLGLKGISRTEIKEGITSNWPCKHIILSLWPPSCNLSPRSRWPVVDNQPPISGICVEFAGEDWSRAYNAKIVNELLLIIVISRIVLHWNHSNSALSLFYSCICF